MEAEAVAPVVEAQEPASNAPEAAGGPIRDGMIAERLALASLAARAVRHKRLALMQSLRKRRRAITFTTRRRRRAPPARRARR